MMMRVVWLVFLLDLADFVESVLDKVTFEVATATATGKWGKLAVVVHEVWLVMVVLGVVPAVLWLALVHLLNLNYYSFKLLQKFSFPSWGSVSRGTRHVPYPDGSRTQPHPANSESQI